jgi:hypothetical protein
MGLILRQASSGAILAGTSDGDTLVWNAAAGEWEAGASLPPGDFEGEPLAWDGSAWGPSPGITVAQLNGHPVAGLNVLATSIGFYGSAPVTQQSIVGATTQQQVDSIVAALVALGLVADAR